MGYKKECGRAGAPRTRSNLCREAHCRVGFQCFKATCMEKGWLQMRAEAADEPCRKSPSQRGEASGDGAKEAAFASMSTQQSDSVRARVRLETHLLHSWGNRRARAGKLRPPPKCTLSMCPSTPRVSPPQQEEIAATAILPFSTWANCGMRLSP